MRKKASDALPGGSWTPLQENPDLAPERADIVIVGGGVVGWSVAYWLKQKERVRGGVKVIVVEKDLTVRTTASFLVVPVPLLTASFLVVPVPLLTASFLVVPVPLLTASFLLSLFPC